MSASRNEGEWWRRRSFWRKKDRDAHKRRADRLEDGRSSAWRSPPVSGSSPVRACPNVDRRSGNGLAASEQAPLSTSSPRGHECRGSGCPSSRTRGPRGQTHRDGKDHALALSEAAKREDALRADGGGGDAAGGAAWRRRRPSSGTGNGGEAGMGGCPRRVGGRLRRAEDAALVARNANATLVTTRKNRGQQARASLPGRTRRADASRPTVQDGRRRWPPGGRKKGQAARPVAREIGARLAKLRRRRPSRTRPAELLNQA